MGKVLPNIEISKVALEEMKNKATKSGEEGSILFFKEEGVPIARKIFHNDRYFGFQYESILENKWSKLRRLYSIKSFQNDVSVIKTFSCQGQLLGYDLTWDEQTQNFEDAITSYEEKRFYFTLIQEKLEYLHSLGIVYGDIGARNILVNLKTKQMSFCDLDNVQIGKWCPIDRYPKCLVPFRKEYGYIDPHFDAYMFNLFVLNELDSQFMKHPKWPYEKLLLTFKQGYQPFYLEEDGKRVLHQMIAASCEGDYDGTYITPYIKRK